MQAVTSMLFRGIGKKSPPSKKYFMMPEWKQNLSHIKEQLEKNSPVSEIASAVPESAVVEEPEPLEEQSASPAVAERIGPAIERFKRDIVSRENTYDAVRRNIIFGECHLLNFDQMHDLRLDISEHFKIHPSEIVLVGSAKLGFSIAPQQRYKHFDEDSDLDVAIVSPILFEQIWQELYSYAKSDFGWSYSSRAKDFKNYLFSGWLRPDKLPSGKAFKRAVDWWEFFNRLTGEQKYGPYTVRGGLYRNWFFFEDYHAQCIRECKAELDLTQAGYR